ncbi:hypothetical protein Tco_0942638 [Tanacetum coccineum]
MGDVNPIRTLGDYSKPSHEGYKNTIELLKGNNVVPLRSDTICCNDPRDFAKPVKAISLPRDISSTFDRRLIELEHQVQYLMEAYIALMQPNQVNKITSSCEICSGPHDTQYCMENPEQVLLNMYPRVLTKREVSGTLSNPSKTTLVTPIIRHGKVTQTLVSSARSYPTEDPQCSTQIHGSINTIAIHQGNPHNDKPEEEEQEENDDLENINTNPSPPPDPSVSFITKKVYKLNLFFELVGLLPQSSNTEFVCIKGDDSDIMFIEINKQDDDTHIKELEVGENAGVGESEVEYFDIFPTKSELAYHKKFFKENENKILSEDGDSVRIYPDADVIFDEKKLGSS